MQNNLQFTTQQCGKRHIKCCHLVLIKGTAPEYNTREIKVSNWFPCLHTISSLHTHTQEEGGGGGEEDTIPYLSI